MQPCEINPASYALQKAEAATTAAFGPAALAAQVQWPQQQRLQRRLQSHSRSASSAGRKATTAEPAAQVARPQQQRQQRTSQGHRRSASSAGRKSAATAPAALVARLQQLRQQRRWQGHSSSASSVGSGSSSYSADGSKSCNVGSGRSSYTGSADNGSYSSNPGPTFLRQHIQAIIENFKKERGRVRRQATEEICSNYPGL